MIFVKKINPFFRICEWDDNIQYLYEFFALNLKSQRQILGILQGVSSLGV